MLKFFKKKPPIEPERKYIPEDKIEEVLAAADAMKGSTLGQYRFWKLIGEIFPDSRYGKWTVVPEYPRPYIFERIG
jgi:hypothetical protein